MQEINTNKEFLEEFAWAIPNAFKYPLSTCRFEQGDLLYNTPKAYQGTWGKALPDISFIAQIKYPPRSLASKSQDDKGSVFATNWNSKVIFELDDRRANKKKTVITTQGRLYMMLWKGDSSFLDKNTNDPLPPVSPMSIVKNDNLAKTVGYFKHLANRMTYPKVFIMPFDRTSLLLSSKFAKIQEHLGEFIIKTKLALPEQTGLISDTGFIPTLRVACFYIDHELSKEVKAALKKALYKSSKNKKSQREHFRLKAHGHFEELD